MKRIQFASVFCILCFSLSTSLFAQNQKDLEAIAPENLAQLRAYEDSLKQLFTATMEAPYSLDSVKQNDEVRRKKMFKFIPAFVNALKTPGSYHYPFDSLKNISVLNAPDNSFRMMTWIFPVMKNYTYKYYGAIQRNNADSLELIALIDSSQYISSPQSRELSPKQWFGAAYYNITKKSWQGKDYYMLFGWDGHTERSSKKVVDVLYFDETTGAPIFGAPIFEVMDDYGNTSIQHRFILEFKSGQGVTLNYLPPREGETPIIIYDYLIPEDEKSVGNYAIYVPDGSYKGFDFKAGLWRPVPKVYHEKSKFPLDEGGGDSKSKGKKKKKNKKRR